MIYTRMKVVPSTERDILRFAQRDVVVLPRALEHLQRVMLVLPQEPKIRFASVGHGSGAR